jgi:ATP-binding cassette subfamily C (CFTR/MRP) protein 1
MGPSGLVALAVLVVGFPIQGIMVKLMIGQRWKGVKITDSRSRLTQEVLGGIRLIKIYAWVSESLESGRVEPHRRAI